MLLGLGLRFLVGVAIGVAAGATVAAVCIYIDGKITEKKMRKEMAKESIKQVLIKEIDKCDNVVKLSDMESEREFVIRGDRIDRKLKKGDVIYV